MKNMISVRRAVAWGAAATIGGSLLTGAAVYYHTTPHDNWYQLYTALDTVEELVDDQFVGEYDADELTDYVLTGFAEGLGDRWTSYMTPETYQNYQNTTAESTVGIGVTVTGQETDDGTVLRVESVAVGSPAEQAGFGAYDEITAVDGETVDALGGYEGAVNAVLGEEGKSVTLTVRHYATGQVEDITVTRQQFEQIHVTSRMLTDDIGYIKIDRFTSETDNQMAKELKAIQDAGATRLIFDLRYNPGGQLGALVNCLDSLLPEGPIISLKSKSGKTEEYTSDENQVDLPMAVLVNADSYSAAEFFAAALQEYEKAIIVGDKTVGKGYSQVGFPLSNGGCLNLSTNCYYTPNGESLIDKGVTPDILVSLDEDKTARFAVLKDEEDDQLQAAISALSQ